MYTDYTAPTMAHTAHISHTAYTAYTAHTEANQTRVFWTDLQSYMTVQDLQISKRLYRLKIWKVSVNN